MLFVECGFFVWIRGCFLCFVVGVRVKFGIGVSCVGFSV